MEPPQETLCGLFDPGALQARISRLFARDGKASGVVGLVYQGRRTTAAFGNPAVSDPGQSPFPAGCFAKLLTAALIEEEIARGRFGLDARLSELLGLRYSRLISRDILIKHLLEHTHGIDDTHLERVPLRENGMVDLGALMSTVTSVPAIAEPGIIYTYSHVGSMLLSAVLETSYGRTYTDILERKLFSRIRWTAQPVSEADGRERRVHVCPATGCGLLTSADNMLSFLAHQLSTPKFSSSDDRSGEGGWRSLQELPGWSPAETGVHRAWKCYGANWFGHQSEWGTMASIVRLNPSLGAGVVLASTPYNPAAVAVRVFGGILPGFVNPHVPRLLDRSADARAESRGFAGEYRNAAYHVRIAATLGGNPLMTVWSRNSPEGRKGIVTDATLAPAEHDLFFSRPPGDPRFAYVQFVTVGGRSFLWNGRWAIPRTPE